MTTANDSPGLGPDDKVSLLSRQQGMAALALLSFGAGFLHAAVIKPHEGVGQISTIFTILAIFQVAWAAAILVMPNRVVLAVGAVVNGATVIGYAMSRTTGISFITGLENKEAVAFTDVVCTGMEVALVIGAVAFLLAGTKRAIWPNGQLGMASLAAVGLVVALLGVPGVSKGATHGEAGHTHGVGEAAGHVHGTGTEAAGHVHGSAADGGHAHIAAKPYDPQLPIDLSGTPGVTPEQQAEAENIIAVSLWGLPQWADYHTAEAAGFYSIGDGGTGIEHYIKDEYRQDEETFNPDKPEALVYDTSKRGTKKLVAAMYMLKEGTPLEDAPKTGGALMQWHKHTNLCFNQQKHVAGLTNAKGECPPGLGKPVETPMIHVWLTKNKCGPFAALEGIGGGTILDSQTRLCDHAHGDGSGG